MEEKKCKKCGIFNVTGRKRICLNCNKIQDRNYYLNVVKKRRLKKFICIICEKESIKIRDTKIICDICKKNNKVINKKYINTNIPGKFVHRNLAESLLGRKLSYNEVVHHIDEDISNNKIDNLWIISRHNHGKLHIYLRYRKLLHEKFHPEKEWKNQLLEENEFFVKCSNIKIIKLIDLHNGVMAESKTHLPQKQTVEIP